MRLAFLWILCLLVVCVFSFLFQEKLLREAKARFVQQAANPADPVDHSSGASNGHRRHAPEFHHHRSSSDSRQQQPPPPRGGSGGAAAPPAGSSSRSNPTSRGPHWASADPFRCLKLPTRAPASEVKAQYRRLCLLYHPDKSAHPQATEAFIAITRAYRMLSNQATGEK